MPRSVERCGSHKGFHAKFFGRAPFPQHEFVASAPHHHRIELAEDFAKVDRRILDDPIVFALRTGIKSIKARSYTVDKLAHRCLKEYSQAVTCFLHLHNTLRVMPGECGPA